MISLSHPGRIGELSLLVFEGKGFRRIGGGGMTAVVLFGTRQWDI